MFLLHIPELLNSAFTLGVRKDICFPMCSIKFLSNHRNGLCVMTGLFFFFNVISVSISILAAHGLEWLKICLISLPTEIIFPAFC